jgi:hypothetical protein
MAGRMTFRCRIPSNINRGDLKRTELNINYLLILRRRRRLNRPVPSPQSEFLRLRFCQVDQKPLIILTENLTAVNIDLGFKDCLFEWYFSAKIHNDTIKVTLVMAGQLLHNPISSQSIHSSMRFPSVYGRAANKMFLRRATQGYSCCRYDTSVALTGPALHHCICWSNN